MEMRKGFQMWICLIGVMLLAAASVLAAAGMEDREYYGHMAYGGATMGYGMMGYGGMGIYMLLYIALGAFIFSIIFWLTYKAMVLNVKKKRR